MALVGLGPPCRVWPVLYRAARGMGQTALGDRLGSRKGNRFRPLPIGLAQLTRLPRLFLPRA